MSAEEARVSSMRYPLLLSLLVEEVAGIYLLTSDKYLKLSGNSLHWYGLLVFTVVNVLLTGLLAAGMVRGAKVASGVWSVVGIAAILGDAASGLALSSFSGGGPYSGWDYLFGFGYIHNSGSVFATSLAVTLILVFAIVSAVMAFIPRRKSGNP